MKYREVAIGNVQNRNMIVLESDIPAIRKKCQENKDEMYVSMFQYDDEILEHMKIRKTVRGYGGRYYLTRILFDLDKGSDTDERLLERTRAFVDGLINYWDIEGKRIELWYSGRGFHVIIPEIFGFTPDNNLPRVVSATLTKHFAGIDDLYSNPTRIIRVGNTINAKSQRYKVRIPYAALSNMDAVVKASLENMNTADAAIDTEPTAEYKHLIIETAPQVITKGGLEINPDAIKAEANAWVTCMQKLWADGPKEGQRHNSILHLASAFRRGGLPEDACTMLLQSWCTSLEPYAIQKAVSDVYKRGLKYGCKDPMMVAYCDPKCYFYKNKNFVLEAKNVTDMEKEFTAFARSGFKEKSIDIGRALDTSFSYPCIPGEFVVVYGDVGVGKSTFVQNLCLKVPHLKVLYISLENDQHLTYRRFVQIHHGMTKQEVYEHYQNGQNGLGSHFSNVLVMTVPPDLKSIGRLIQDNEANLIVIDTTDMIQVEGKFNGNDKVDAIAIGLKEYAMQQKCIIIGVHHISKDAAEKASSFGLTVHSGKGSSSIEQKADKVIGIEPEGDTIRKVKALKSRDEGYFESHFQFDKSTFRFTPTLLEGGRTDTVVTEDGWIQ